MPLSNLLRPWAGTAFRHAPADGSRPILNFSLAGLSPLNRWNDPGQPTLYLAGDEGVLITEWGRHFRADRPQQVTRLTDERTVFRLALAFDATLDLRDQAVCSALAIEQAPVCFTSRETARSIARYVRDTTPAQAIFVPPMGMLDQPDRWCLVVFLDKLPADPRQWVTDASPIGPLRWG